MLVGREGKLDSMEKNFASAGPKFIVIYGNHRCGKTKLLSEFAKGKKGVFLSAQKLNSFMNLRLFEKAVSEYSGVEESFPGPEGGFCQNCRAFKRRTLFACR